MNINWVGARNAAIILGLAAIVLVWQEGFGDIAGSAGLVLTVLFVAAIIGFAYNYFRQNNLAWLVLKGWQRVVIIACVAAIALLILFGFPFLGERISPLGVMALIAALVLVIVWIVRESRRFR